MSINDGQGHGHVKPRADGHRARCGGPTLCKDCAAEKAELDSIIANFNTAVLAQNAIGEVFLNQYAEVFKGLAGPYDIIKSPPLLKDAQIKKHCLVYCGPGICDCMEPFGS
jgi:hypothetical protein